MYLQARTEAEAEAELELELELELEHDYSGWRFSVDSADLKPGACLSITGPSRRSVPAPSVTDVCCFECSVTSTGRFILNTVTKVTNEEGK